jgi:hypothetical protein
MNWEKSLLQVSSVFNMFKVHILISCNEILLQRIETWFHSIPPATGFLLLAAIRSELQQMKCINTSNSIKSVTGVSALGQNDPNSYSQATLKARIRPDQITSCLFICLRVKNWNDTKLFHQGQFLFYGAFTVLVNCWEFGLWNFRRETVWFM